MFGDKSRCLITIIVALILTISLSNSAIAVDLTFGDWATAQGYTPPGATNWVCDAGGKAITSADGANSYTNLQELRLDNNQISSLSANQFLGLTNLLELNLWGNQISSISADQFQGLSNLQHLQLGDNPIASLSANQFQGLAALDFLSVSNSQITSVDANAFLGLGNLTVLFLDDNPMSSLSANQFQGLGNLGELFIQGCSVSSLDANAFQGLTNVWNLALAGNNISSLSANQFQGMTSLLYLDLGSNQIAALSPNMFQGLANLDSLDLDVNQISSLSANTFQGLTNLDKLYLENNQISSLDLTGFEATALTRFDIETNPIADVVLADATLSQITFDTLMIGHETYSPLIGIAELAGIGSVDLSGADISGVDQLDEMFGMADLDTLILTDALFSGAVIAAGYGEVWDLISALEGNALDALTVNQQLYAAMQTNLDAWDAGVDNVLTVVPEPATPGDFDGDNDVDGTDFGLWQGGYPTASGASLGDGDADGDGDVDGVDFGIWQANYPTNLGGATAIPEPATLGLLLLGGLALLRRRR